MTVILPSRINAYAGSPLDRAAQRRDDDAWVDNRLHDRASLFVPVWRARTLVTGEDAPKAVFLTGADAEQARLAGGPWAFLGLLGRTGGLRGGCQRRRRPAAAHATRARPVRGFAHARGRLPGADAAVLAHGRALMHWRARHRFCGVCGAACVPKSGGHMQLCSGCGTHHFPRTDPAVIMLVHREGRALLGHSQRFPNTTMYSTLAGFVEPGESLEEAVAREVLEEVGVRVGAVRYHSSQPWPFPSNIMLGFYAEGLSDEITLQQDELRDARWFGRDELRDPAAHGFQLPRLDSIARRLIEDWMEHG